MIVFHSLNNFEMFVVKFLVCVVYVSVILCDISVDDELKVTLKEALCRNCLNETTSDNCYLEPCNCDEAQYNLTSEFNVTETNNSPYLHCKSDQLISLTWNVTQDSIYFLEVVGNARHFTNVTKCGSYIIHDLSPNNLYNIRLWELSQGVYSVGPYLEVQTMKTEADPQSVSNIYVKNLKLIKEDNEYEAIIKWEPGQDMSCYYDLVWTGMNDFEDYKQIEIKEVTNTHEATIPNLQFGTNYTLSIMAITLDSSRESKKTDLNIAVPTCLATYANLDKCVPETPKKLFVEEYIVNVDNDVGQNPLFNVLVRWEKPTLQPSNYTAYLFNFLTNTYENSSRKCLNISGKETEATFRKIELGMNYQVHVKAWSKAGSSNTAIVNRHVSGIKAVVTKPSSRISEIVFILIGPLVCVVLIIGSLLALKYYKKSEKELDEKRSKYFLELKDKSSHRIDNIMVEHSVSSEAPDEWELSYDNLILQSVLGEGEFGIVRNGWLHFDGEKKMEVAIKMLKDMPTQTELRQFYQEIEIMKSVGSHPHLVSMIGCVTKNSIAPLLVVEYCSNGDLQTYLRDAWEKLNNQSSNSSYLNMSKSSEDISKQFSNKMYDMDCIFLDNEEYLQPKDLISFARQVVLGMEYLSNLRVLHRDLATRNVLVCEDKTIKISDFGLSRDVYRDNIYCKTGNGKLPIRWMALESMTHQCYTTQSDVWSFGILLWEIVTLGGNPYPGVTTQDLLPLLKSGYRMEQPPNCSDELYNIMLDCWKTVPKDRPTFSELRVAFDNLLEGISHYINLNLVTSNEIHYFRPKLTYQKEVDVQNRYVKAITPCRQMSN